MRYTGGSLTQKVQGHFAVPDRGNAVNQDEITKQYNQIYLQILHHWLAQQPQSLDTCSLGDCSFA